jgi:hypothetical protein
MATDPNQPSFSRGRKWTIGFNVTLAVLVVLAVVVMVNYLSSRYPKRFYLSSNTRIELSPRTVSLLHSITNPVQVTLYYDRDEPLFGDVSELLREYHSTNPKVTITTVDYLRDPGAALELRTKYNLGSSTNKNWVIFDCDDRVQKVEGTVLAQYTLEQVPNETAREFRKRPVAFNGEMMFTTALLGVINSKPLHAFFLQGHGEHLPDGSEMGFGKFVSVLQANYVQVERLELLGTNTVPLDCNLLVIAGPRDPIPQVELDRIEQYLNEGGRMFVMFNVAATNRETGLEKILAKWGVQVGDSTISDTEYTTAGNDVIAFNFSRHPAVNPLTGSRLQMILPRPISKLESNTAASDEDGQVQEIAHSGPQSVLRNGDASQKPQSYPLMVAVERAPAKALTQRGITRILVIGDSLFLGNIKIESGANRDFANYAANWLLERNTLAQGLGPRSVTEFRLLIPEIQMRNLQWILLAAVPGGILLLGGIVWLSRRK